MHLALDDAVASGLFTPCGFEFVGIDARLFHFAIQLVNGLELVFVHDLLHAAVDVRLDIAFETAFLGFLDEQLFVDEARDEFAMLFIGHLLGLFAGLALFDPGIDDVLCLAANARERDHAVIYLRDDLVDHAGLRFLSRSGHYRYQCKNQCNKK